MYDILELSKKLLHELKEIAKGLNIKKIESLKKQDLIYKILNQHAIESTGNLGSSKKSSSNSQLTQNKFRQNKGQDQRTQAQQKKGEQEPSTLSRAGRYRKTSSRTKKT